MGLTKDLGALPRVITVANTNFVGINNTNPIYNFDINGGNSSTFLRVSRDTGYAMLGAGLGFSAVYSRNNLNVARDLILDASKVGIGTETPTGKLHVADPNNFFVASFTGNSSNTISLGTFGTVPSVQGFTSGGANSVISLQPNGGNVLIGTTTDSGNRLTVNGSARISTVLSANIQPTAFAGVAAGFPSSATIPLGYSMISVSSPCDNVWRTVLTNINDSKCFVWITMGDAASKDTASYTWQMVNPSYGVAQFVNVSYMDGGWNTGGFELSYSSASGAYTLAIRTTSWYSSGNTATGTIHFLRLE